MKSHLLVLAAVAAASVSAQIACANPGGIPNGGGGPGGPPASVTMGPPASAMHGPPSTVTQGPPATATQGPPSAATQGPPAGATHVPNGLAKGHADIDKAANLLGNLNAAHASDKALEHASPKSVVGAIAAYKKATVTAKADVVKYTDLVAADQTAVNSAQAAVDASAAKLAELQAAPTPDTDAIAAAQAQLATDQAALASAQQQLAADQASLDAAQTAVTAAQTALAERANKPLTEEVIAQLNTLLGI